MRAILTGAPYPLTLLTSVLMRLRSDGDVNARRVSILKAILKRNFGLNSKEAPVALEPENIDKAYLLGRLFATLEKIQQVAHDYKLNSTIRDQYYGSVSANPRSVFPLLLRLNLHHLSKAAKGDKAKLARYLANQMGDIINGLTSEFPAALNLRDQGKFALGYFHQLNFRNSSTKGESGQKAEDSAS